MNRSRRMWWRLLVLAISTIVLAAFGAKATFAQDSRVVSSVDNLNNVHVAIDMTWVFVTGFLVFFLQIGFAFLETGITRKTGAVNILRENFLDALLTTICWWAIGFGVAFVVDNSSGLFGTNNFFLGQGQMSDLYPGLNIGILTLFFFQFAFAATASTVTTGAMTERKDFIGVLIYGAIIAAVIYPVVAYWVWGGGWLFQQGFHDFAGSTVVYTVGGVIAIVAAWMFGSRPKREWGKSTKRNYLGYPILGTMILWFGWYGFNPGSAPGSGNSGLIGLVILNTILGLGAGALAMLLFVYTRTGKWSVSSGLRGALAGLVAITASSAFVEPTSAVLIGIVAGVLIVLAGDLSEQLKIDDGITAIAVYGACGIWGTLAIGLFALPALTFAGPMAGKAGLLVGGSFDILGVQALGSIATILYVGITSVLMLGLLKIITRLRVQPDEAKMAADFDVNGASGWPDGLSVRE